MRNEEIQALSDKDYAAWRLRQLRISALLSKVGLGLSFFALAFAIYANTGG